MEFDYLREDVAENISQRMLFVNKKFPKCCEFGTHKAQVPKLLQPDLYGIETLYLCDRNDKEIVKTLVEDVESETLPFEEGSLDLIISTLDLHWVNDLPTTLNRMMKCLKPDGMFMGCMFGGNTLQELRSCFALSEQEREGGVSPHTSPLASPRDASNVLSRAGFAIPTVDSEVITVYYPDALTLMYHLQCMGENNAVLDRRRSISRETLIGAAALYDELFRTERGVYATFEIVYMIGWRPDPSQPKPAKRGSGEISLKSLAEEFGTKLEVIHEDEEDTTTTKS